ncbi:hypothetical protein ACFL2J_03570 [Candidatus Omnitrophota bacterium]
MTKKYNRLKKLIFDEVDKDDLWKTTFRIAETSLDCYTNSASLRSHIESFFYFQPHPIRTHSGERLSIHFLVLDNKSKFVKRLLRDLESEWMPIDRGNPKLKWNFEVFQAKGNPNLLLFGFFGATFVIGIVDLKSYEGFYLMPERDSNEIGLDESVFHFVLSEIFWSKEYLLIHASCVSDNNNNGILVTGSSGKGKTTFCLKLLEEGFHFLSNDLVLLKQRSNYVEAFGIPEKRIKVRQIPASLFPNLKVQGKKRNDKGRGHITTDRFYSGNKKVKCKVRVLGIADSSINSLSTKISPQQLMLIDYMGLTSVINLFIPREKTVIDNKLSLVRKLFTTTKYFRFFLPRGRYRLKKALNKNIEEIKVLMHK